jgi:hypothetical protein
VGKLQTGRFERLGARTYSIKGPGALVDLDETVLGVLQLERQAGMEAHLMQEWETFGQNMYSPNTAGRYSYVLLSNPVGSGRLIVLDAWQRGGANTANSLSGYMTRGVPPGFVVQSPGVGLDTRITTSRQPAGQIFAEESLSSSYGTRVLEQATEAWVRYTVVLAPDGSFVWGGNAHNESVGVAVRWAERDAAPFEL